MNSLQTDNAVNVTMEVASLLTHLRTRLMPVHSRREVFYTRFVRPLVVREFFRHKQGANSVRAAEAIEHSSTSFSNSIISAISC
ncbi:MAG: hypothetical protein K8U03_09070 [Planctomycetia bacterium]|nr:hypothetical protein [Planctomycetia bacterium]